MIGPFFVVAVLLLELGVIYGVGFLCFAWWDGGVMRRLLMAGCVGVVVYALHTFLTTHPIRF